MKRALFFTAGWLAACAGEDVMLFNVQSGGSGNAGGGANQAGSAQGGATQGGAIQGGAAQGGAAQSGAAQGGAAQGGNLDGGSAGTMGMCRTNLDCEAGFCQKSQCFDDVGHCERRDVICEGQKPTPVCGCDGITYFNDCWRRQAGIASSTSGECRSQAILCGRSSDCPSGAQCAHLFAPGDSCGPPAPPAPGICWVVPAMCDASLDPIRFTECGGPNVGRCADTCGAVRSGHPFIKAAPGSCP